MKTKSLITKYHVLHKMHFNAQLNPGCLPSFIIRVRDLKLIFKLQTATGQPSVACNDFFHHTTDRFVVILGLLTMGNKQDYKGCT